MTILYVNGCELSSKEIYFEDNKTMFNSWSDQLVNNIHKFNSLVNHSVQYGSNDRILRTSFEWISENMDEDEIIAIIQPTQIVRREILFIL